MSKKEKKIQKELDELREVAASAVNGYEKYLLDELNYSNLARIMSNLRHHLPMGATGSNEK
jgi:hypothetical protein